MKALIFEKRIVELSEKDFPVAKPMYWADYPSELIGEPVEIEELDIIEERQEIDEETGETIPVRVVVGKTANFKRDDAEIARRETEKLKQEERKAQADARIAKKRARLDRAKLADLKSLSNAQMRELVILLAIEVFGIEEE
jgi:restriction endonuclease Mrr